MCGDNGIERRFIAGRKRSIKYDFDRISLRIDVQANGRNTRIGIDFCLELTCIWFDAAKVCRDRFEY
jgi:hypothetical protein